MYKFDWVKPLLAGLPLLVFVIVWASYYVGSQIGETRGERNYHSTSYERHASDEIRDTCLSGKSRDIAECIAEVIKATNEDRRAEENRVAQSEMGRWTLYMFIVNVIMAAFTGAGVIFVWLTLKATQAMAGETSRIGNEQVSTSIAAVNTAREANEVAARQFRMGFKPHLKLTISGPYIDEDRYSLDMFGAGDPPRRTGIDLLLEIKNIGEHPATITGFYIGVLDPPFKIDSWPKTELWMELSKGDRRVLTRYSGMLPEPTPGRKLAHVGEFTLTPEIRDELFAHPPRVVGHIDYLDILGVKRQLGFCVAPVSATGFGLERWGGDEHNYDREID